VPSTTAMLAAAAPAAAPAEEKLGPAAALGDAEWTWMAGVYLPLDQDNLPGCVTHLCPRGPVFIGLGPDWSESRNAIKYIYFSIF
jgi:hypothetical protein